MIYAFIFFSLSGALAGFLSGLLGIGGGVIVVPILAWIFVAFSSVPHSATMHVAAGTSLAAMIITSLAASFSHHQRGNVDWLTWRKLLPSTIVGVVFGVLLASTLETRALSIIFACVLILIALQIFFFSKQKENELIEHPHWFIFNLAGLLVGACSGLLGIGGGALLIPFLLHYHFPMNKTAGTSAACIVPLSILGTLMFMITGQFHEAAPIPYSTGFIYWPAFIGVAIGSVLFVHLGTWVGARANKKLLKRIFSCLLVLIALQLIL